MSPPTQVAGRYVIERRLGAGGMSTVFKANDTVLERPVAVKLLEFIPTPNFPTTGPNGAEQTAGVNEVNDQVLAKIDYQFPTRSATRRDEQEKSPLRCPIR